MLVFWSEKWEYVFFAELNNWAIMKTLAFLLLVAVINSYTWFLIEHAINLLVMEFRA